MINYLKKKFLNILKINRINQENEEIKLILGKLLSDANLNKNPLIIQDIEYKIFSQWGDDGIIQFIINKLDLDDEYKNFIEFGVENYSESNTRFLLFNNNWSGLILDSSKKNIEEIKNSNYYWKYDLEAICSFITKENINSLIADSRISKKIGLLSIDIDGNDYWIWEKINTIEPLIVVVEFNSNFGFQHKISIPYDANFERNKAHYSNLYWGTSLEALKFLAKKKDYKFVCTNSSGNNAYFVKSSHFTKLNINLKVNSHSAKFRESRNIEGKKNYLSSEKKINEIMDLEVIDVESNIKKKLKLLLK